MAGMDKLYSAAEAASEVGASQRTIQRLCKDHSIGKVFGTSLVLTADDVAKLSKLFSGGPGRPKGSKNKDDSKRKGKKKVE